MSLTLTARHLHCRIERLSRPLAPSSCSPVARPCSHWAERGSETPAPPSETAAEPTIEPSSAVPPTGLVHRVVDGLGFDYPTSWSVSATAGQMDDVSGVEVIGTAPSTAGCTRSATMSSCG